MTRPIYLDYNATTPIDPAVRAAMLPFLAERFGNPSSNHLYGHEAAEAVAHARAEVANLIGASTDEIVFTASGSEASNLAIKGVVFAAILSGQTRPHVVTSAVEHPATLAACEWLRRWGCEITIVPVNSLGQVDADDVSAALRPNTVLVSIMHSNNEVGTLQPVQQVASIVKSRNVMFHTDAAQSIGKLPVSVVDLNADLVTIVGHKVYAPKGIAALFVRRGVQLEPLIHGASHESGRRAGTESVPNIVALGAACRIAGTNLATDEHRLRTLRDRLHQKLLPRFGEKLVLNGHPTERLPNTLNVSFLDDSGADILKQLPEIAASTGSACHEGGISISPVLAAMGVPSEVAQGAVRFSVGRMTTESEIDDAVALITSKL